MFINAKCGRRSELPFDAFLSLFRFNHLSQNYESLQSYKLRRRKTFFGGEGRSPRRDFLRVTPDAASAFGRLADRLSLPVELLSAFGAVFSPGCGREGR